MRIPRLALLLVAAMLPAAANAELPASVRAMIDAAIAEEDPATVRKVIALARKTNPDDATEIEAILAGFEADQARLAAEQKASREAQIRQAGLFDNWDGKGELGAFRATGNSSNTGLTASIGLTREGLDWRHKLRARADYQRSNGTTTREQFLLAYEPNYRISDRVFLYGLAQYERDQLQGFSGRYSVSGGVGYRFINKEDLQFSAKIGPAYRVTDFVTGENESRIAGLLGLDLDWNITDRLKLTHDTNTVAETGGSATVIVDSSNTSINLVTGLNAKISDKVSTRFSYAVEYDSNPPEGAVQTDTLSRVTLIYDF